MASLFFEPALLPDGWADDVRITFAGSDITSIETGAVCTWQDERQQIGLPAIASLHSHAF